MTEAYDIIGDIHGCVRTLAALLEKLGYRRRDGVYRHPSRRAVFVGDFIDRGPGQRQVIDTVRPMVEAGTALAVMGNHEFNAIAWATRDPLTGEPLRAHDERHRRQHRAFLDAHAGDPAAYDEAIRWFRTLPLWLDLGPLRVVHACWDPRGMEVVRRTAGGPYLTDALLHRASRRGSPEHEAVETLLKGKEIRLPNGAGFRDKDGNHRHHIRVRWWDRGATTCREAFMGPASAATRIPDDPIEGDHLVEYSHDDAPVFLGHYWLEGDPVPLAANVACVDYSVARPGGRLVAYRWCGERHLDAANFCQVLRRD